MDAPIKALLIAVADDAPAAIYAINRLKPDLLCFFVAEPAKALIETAVQPYIVQMPRRWDWLITSHADRFMPSYQALARDLPDLLRTWDVGAGDLVIDLTGATSAMAAAMALAGVPYASRVVMIGRSEATTEGEAIHIDGQARIWTQGNPWDEAAAPARRDACDVFNRGAFGTAASLFRHIETRVSGGQKPLYRALADLTDGYALWERFQHRQAWDKLKTSLKALDMASVWGGPAGLKALLPAMKQNAGFLEKLVLDPHEVKETLAYDLLAHAKRRAETDHHLEAAVMTLLRALEAFAQHRLFKQYRIKSWDVRPEQLPAALQESCRTCYLNDIDGKYKLPLLGQFQTLAGLGDTMGQAYQAQWIKMKPLLDAAGHAVLAHGFEPVKPERFQQLYDMVLKVTGVSDTALPRFPVLNL
ncbi:MAG: TIGR02710 family CRISPR-associated protein [Nitrospiraceae bacterium]|nr:TIGR02710 family CRISPR-associated protein [Nitrospiraceae bacterium]